MAEFKVRGVDETVVESLDQQAAAAGMSREAYVRWLVQAAATAPINSQSIRLTEPLPCGILTGAGNCGRPAHAATIWPGPVPGQWTMLPVCETDAKRLAQLYNILEEE